MSTGRKQLVLGNNDKDPYGDPDGIVTSPKDLKCSASTEILVKAIADKLEREFPGWLWAVSPDEYGGCITIRSLRLSGLWGYLLHVKNLQHDPQLKLARVAAGEILERFGQRRGPYDYSRWVAQPKKFGLADFDISDKDARTRRRRNDDDFTDAVRRGELKIKVVDRETATGTHRKLYVQPSALWDKRD